MPDLSIKVKRIPATLLLTLALTIPASADSIQSGGPDQVAVGPRIASLVRLSQGPMSPEGLGELRLGLAADVASIRAAAARVAHSKGVVDLLPELRQALAAEKDTGPALEEAWAIADLDTATGSDQALLEAVARPDIQAAVVRGIVAARGPRAATSWSAFKAAFEAQAPSVIAGLGAGLYQDSGTLFASFAVRDGMDTLFDALLSSQTIHVDPSVAVAGMAASSSPIRRASYFFLAALPSAPPACEGCEKKEPEDLSERFARHLFEAGLGAARSETLEVLLGALAKDESAKKTVRDRYRDRPRSFQWLSNAERTKLAKVIDWKRDGPTWDPSLGGASTIRTLGGGHPDGLVGAVLEATHCVGKDGSLDAVEVWHRPGGRLARLAPLTSGNSQPGCGEAAELLGLTSLASDGVAHAVTVLPERPAFLACLAESRPLARSRPAAAQTVGKIQEPRKVRNVPPVYPVTSKNRGLQGVVIVEATISETGCVNSIRVLRSVGAELDLSAIDAVSGWAYTPTLLDGIPVPVIMTVTVNFRLN